jgi:hypothetical protein
MADKDGITPVKAVDSLTTAQAIEDPKKLLAATEKIKDRVTPSSDSGAGAVDSAELSQNSLDELQSENLKEKETKEEQKSEKTDEQKKQEEAELKKAELEKKIAELNKKIEEDLKKGDMEAYKKDLLDLQTTQKELDTLLQPAANETTVPASAPSVPGQQSFTPIAPSITPIFTPPVSSSGGSSPANQNGVPVKNDSTPVAGRPHGLSEINSTFGRAGTNLVSKKMAAGPGGKEINVTCNAKIADKMAAAFEEIKAKGLSDEIHSFDGSYNYRNKRGGSSLSTHSWGIAFDINASENPMGSSKQTAGQRQLAEIFAKYGFYQLPNDPMHFQYCTGY